MRAAPLLAVCVFAATLLAACSGDEQTTGEFTAADAERLAAVRPDGPGWTWPVEQDQPQQPVEGADEPADSIFAAYRARTRDLEGGREQGGRWKDADKVANLTVQTFASPAEADVGFDALNDLSRAYGEKYASVTRSEEIAGLGDEAWVLWASGYGHEVTYHWRRANLVVEAHVQCWSRCPTDLDAATRVWVDAIDAEGRT